ncbi:hypothetical protein KR084_001205 [Drosophila pseudotakahashii]|nr:hypothetical protein KR084_001205 [Drosophila pseudotakahashii]
MAIVLDLRHERLSQEAAAAAAAAAPASYSSHPNVSTNDAQGYPNMPDYSQDSYFSGYQAQDQTQNQSLDQPQAQLNNGYNYQNEPKNDYYYQNQAENSHFYQNQPENRYFHQDQPENAYLSQLGYGRGLSYQPNRQPMMPENSMASMQAEQPMPPLAAYPMQQSDCTPSNLNQPQEDELIPDFIRDFWPELMMSPDYNAASGSNRSNNGGML